MKTLLLLSLLLSFLFPFQSPTHEGSPVTVTHFKWERARRTVQAPAVEGNAPASAMIPQNRNFSRNARINEPRGARDPNADTVDGRSAALEKTVAESRAPKPEPMDGYAYKIKVHNPGSKEVEAVFWEYRFHDPANPNLVGRRQFLCAVKIGAGKEKELEGFSLSGPSDVVDVKTLNSGTPLKEQVLINRVDYTDGSMKQRKTWNFEEVKGGYERALRESWHPGMCKAL